MLPAERNRIRLEGGRIVRIEPPGGPRLQCLPAHRGLSGRGHRVAVTQHLQGDATMNRIIWLVGAVVIVLFVLGYFGLR